VLKDLSFVYISGLQNTVHILTPYCVKFQLILMFSYVWRGIENDFSVFRTKICMHFSSLLSVLYVPSPHLILLEWSILMVRGTDYEASCRCFHSAITLCHLGQCIPLSYSFSYIVCVIPAGESLNSTRTIMNPKAGRSEWNIRPSSRMRLIAWNRPEGFQFLWRIALFTCSSQYCALT
jgi:hypothetical protein